MARSVLSFGEEGLCLPRAAGGPPGPLRMWHVGRACPLLGRSFYPLHQSSRVLQLGTRHGECIARSPQPFYMLVWCAVYDLPVLHGQGIDAVGRT
jgi:hypothetical protein